MLKSVLSRGGVFAVADQGVNSLASFLTTVLIARMLGAHDFGTYSLLFVAMMTLTGLVNTVVSEPIRTLGVNGAPALQSQYVGAQLTLAACVGMGVASVVVGGLVLFRAVDISIALPVGLAVFVAGGFEALRALAASRHEWQRMLTGDVIAQLAKLSMLVALLYEGQISIASGYWVLAAAGLCGAFVLYLLGAKPAAPDRRYLLGQARSHVMYGRWLSLESVVYLLSTQLYIYLIALLVDVNSAGAFAAAQTLINAANIIWMGVTSSSVSTARGILIAQGAHARRKWLLSTGTRLAAFVALLVALISLCAQPLMGLLFTPAYARYAHVVPILAIATILMAINSLLNVAFRTLDMPQMGFRGKAVSAVVTSLIGIPLIRELGITGAALGMIVTQVCWTAVYLWGLRSIRSSWAARIDGIRTAYHFPVAGLPITRPS